MPGLGLKPPPAGSMLPALAGRRPGRNRLPVKACRRFTAWAWLHTRLAASPSDRDGSRTLYVQSPGLGRKLAPAPGRETVHCLDRQPVQDLPSMVHRQSDREAFYKKIANMGPAAIKQEYSSICVIEDIGSRLHSMLRFGSTAGDQYLTFESAALQLGGRCISPAHSLAR